MPPLGPARVVHQRAAVAVGVQEGHPVFPVRLAHRLLPVALAVVVAVQRMGPIRSRPVTGKMAPQAEREVMVAMTGTGVLAEPVINPPGAVAPAVLEGPLRMEQRAFLETMEACRLPLAKD
jgi:hypothetical protein